MNLKNKFWYFDTGLSKDFCDDVIKHGLNQTIQVGLTNDTQLNLTDEKINQQQNTIRKSNVSWLEDKWILDEIRPFFIDANISSNWNFDIDEFESFQFTIYKDTNYYDWHIDMGEEPYKEGPLKGKIRKLSMSILLSDPNDFEGGNLEFDYRENDSPITRYEFANKGSCVVFPSFIYHRVTPVTKGTRYSLVIWAVGKAFR